MTKKIVCQAVTSKSGTAKTGKPFTKYGLKDAEGVWYSSFNPTNAVEGGEYEIEYETNQYGNELKSIKALSETSNKTSYDNRNRSIVRQHSQEMAIRYQAMREEICGLDELKKVIDWFEKDVEQTELPF